MKKAIASKSDIYLALLDFRNTPSEDLLTSPVQRLYGRRTRSLLPMTSSLLTPDYARDTKEKLQELREKQAKYYNNKSKKLPCLHPGDRVRMKLPGQETWSQALVQRKVASRSYEVTCGPRKYRRNRRQLRTTSERYTLECCPPMEHPMEVDVPEPPSEHLTEPLENSPVPPQTTEANSSACESRKHHGNISETLDQVPQQKFTNRVRAVKVPERFKDFVMT